MSGLEQSWMWSCPAVVWAGRWNLGRHFAVLFWSLSEPWDLLSLVQGVSLWLYLMLPLDLGMTNFLQGWRLWDERMLRGPFTPKVDEQSALGFFRDLGHRGKV